MRSNGRIKMPRSAVSTHFTCGCLSLISCCGRPMNIKTTLMLPAGQDLPEDNWSARHRATRFAANVSGNGARCAIRSQLREGGCAPAGGDGEAGGFRFSFRQLVEDQESAFEGQGLGRIRRVRRPCTDSRAAWPASRSCGFRRASFSGMGLRLLDVERKLWADFFVNAKSGVLTPPAAYGKFCQWRGDVGFRR